MLAWRYERGDGGKDVRKKVEQAIPREDLHVATQLESLCRSVHLNRVPGKPNDDEQTHQCAERDLHSIYSVYDPKGGAALELAD